MKRNVLFIGLLIPLSIFAQEGLYTISGKIGNYNAPAKVYLLSGRNLTDSATLKNGVFEFKGKISEPRKANLLFDKKGVGLQTIRTSRNVDYTDFYLVEGKTVVAAQDSIEDASITGTAINNEYKTLKSSLKPANSALTAVLTEYRTASKEKQQSEAFEAEIDKKYEAALAEINKIQTEFIKTNPNSIISLDVIKSLIGSGPVDVQVIEPLFNGLSQSVQNSESGVAFAAELNKNKKIAIGAIAPDFAQTDVQGKMVKLSDFKGKYVLIDFWASWCGPCRRENPNVVKAFNQYKDKNFTILGVSLDAEKQKDAWIKAIADDQLTWTQVSDLKGWDNEVGKLYMVRSIPQNFLIDPNGKIVARNLRGEDLEKKLAELIK
ncbi:MAG: alkyl hydroperoxide reductase/Thiol specific antioxidant/Mal allergen [Bacteroidetes bacterium]|nr:alkyl hydroperoxide reductase/Thiol specific antioxidant/Mal allergen [Bacteroidota bacterium]